MTGSACKRWTLYGRSGGLKEQREGVWGRERARGRRGLEAGGFLFRARAHAHMPGEIAFFRSVSVSLLGSFLGAILGRSWAVLGRSWVVLGRSWDGLGAVLGWFWVVLGGLGRSWGIFGGQGRSWGDLGVVLGGLGVVLGGLAAVLGGLETDMGVLCRTHSLQSAMGLLWRTQTVLSVISSPGFGAGVRIFRWQF